MSSIISKQALGFLWKTQDPFLFCAHHVDAYPKGRETLGPDMPLGRRQMGQDFDLSNDWKMYHGMLVPGFPEHPHRGFETVTIVLEGFVDHSDSAGACGRYGQGDVQWMTAGKGMQHAEMFPLVYKERSNPLHLFQIWLNLPAKDKFVEPHYKMLWNEDIPVIEDKDSQGNDYRIKVIAGVSGNIEAVKPAPDSWAYSPDHHVDILLVDLSIGASVDLPSKSRTQKRALYLYQGASVSIDGEGLEGNHQAFLSSDARTITNNGQTPVRFLLLQGEAINEPVAQYGPFVMNTNEEIKEAYDDYGRTGFGGWPWDRSDPVHGSVINRFAKYSDGRYEERPVGEI